jgi:hypothetical protein
MGEVYSTYGVSVSKAFNSITYVVIILFCYVQKWLKPKSNIFITYISI